jgi:hypothetical protein
MEKHPIPDCRGIKPGHFGKTPTRFDHSSNASHRGTSSNFGKKTIEKSSHGILPLFAHNRF